MKQIAVIFWNRAGLCAVSVLAQRPSNPALLVPQEAPALDYVAVADPIPVPADLKWERPRASPSIPRVIFTS